MNRYLSIDTLRGLIMVIMAIDHALGAWAVGKDYFPEIALPASEVRQFPPSWKQYTDYKGPGTEFSRLATHVCAPGFQLLAGLGLAISVARSRRQGMSELKITGDMVLRGVVLILCDWFIMTYAYGGLPWVWLVLCCIGSATIMFSVLRFWPLPLIGVFSAAVLVLQPLYCPEAIDVTSAANYVHDIWGRIAFGGPNPTYFVVLYPIFPWIGLFGLGWVLGTIYESRPADHFKWLIPLGLGLMLLGLSLRWFTGTYGDRMPGGEEGPLSLAFWVWSKYPPSPVFTITTLGWLLLMLGLFRPLDFQENPSPNWQYLAVLGRVALFFYVVHFYFYGVTWFAYAKLHQHYWFDPNIPKPWHVQGKVSLGWAYVVWVMGLLVVWPLCRWYDKLRQKHKRVLRYF